MTDDGNTQFWIDLSSLVNTKLASVVEDARADSSDPVVTAGQLADIGAPLIWCASLVAVAARADREAFLNICGQLYDKAQVAYATGQPLASILNPIQHRGQA